MQATVNFEELQRALKVINSVLAKHSVVEWAKAVKITAQDNLMLESYGPEHAVKALVGADVKEPGEFIVDGTLIASDILKLKEDSVEIKADTTLQIAGRYKLVYPALDTQLPEKEALNPIQEIELDGTLVKTAIKHMMKVASKDPFVRNMNGVYINISDGIEFIATDGFRLHYAKLEDGNGSASGILPLDPLKGAVALITDSVLLKPFVAGMGFESEGIELKINYMDADFPNWKRAVPEGEPVAVYEDHPKAWKELFNTLSNVMKNDVVILDTSTSTITSKNPDIGKSIETSLTAKAIKTGDMKIGFNSAHMLDAVNFLSDIGKLIDADTIQVELRGPTTAIKLVLDDNFWALVMPIRLNV